MDAKDMLSLPDDEFRAHVVEYLATHDAAIAENTALTRKVEEDTAFIRSILTDVAAGARLLCRLAATWRFLIRQVMLPIGLPMLVLYVIVLVVGHRPVPEWLVTIVKILG